jgi:hypothetical protein
MKKLFGLLAVSISLLMVVSAPVAQAQGQAPAPAGKVWEGELTKVDSAAQTLSGKGATGPEMTFNYTAQTQVIGPEKSVQGLAGKTGTHLRISYTDQGGKLTATRIEMVEKK